MRIAVSECLLGQVDALSAVVLVGPEKVKPSLTVVKARHFHLLSLDSSVGTT